MGLLTRVVVLAITDEVCILATAGLTVASFIPPLMRNLVNSLNFIGLLIFRLKVRVMFCFLIFC